MRKNLFKSLFFLGLITLLSGCFHIQLNGSVVGATVTITPLGGGGNSIVFGPSISDQFWINSMGEDAWLDLPPLIRLAFVGMAFLPDNPDIDPEAWYIVEASGGSDNDPNLTMDLSDSPRPVQGTWHALVKGDRILKGNLKVSTMTEAAYQYLLPELSSLTDMELMTRLDEVAGMLFSASVDTDGDVDKDDILFWNSSLDGAKYDGDRSVLTEMVDAVTRAENNQQVLFAIAEAIIEKSTGGLNGNWSGQSLDGASNVDGSYSLTILGNNITSISRNNSVTGATGVLSPSSTNGIFDIAFSDNRAGHLIMLGATNHALLVDENLFFAILELGGGPRGSYTLAELNGNFIGNGVATLLYPTWFGPAPVTLNCSMSGSQVRCNASSTAGFAYGLSNAPTNGLYPTAGFDDDDDFEGDGWLMMSNDKSVIGLVFCQTYSDGITSKDCGFAPLMRQ